MLRSDRPLLSSQALRSDLRYPFGQPVLPRRPAITESRPLFVLGAYPSALHVFWRPPSPYQPIQAIAVDNEPDIFWDGEGEQERVDTWIKTVGFQHAWGEIKPARKLNGSSGKWVNGKVLRPLKCCRQDTWLTDCLDTYRCSVNLAKRLKDTYRPLADQCGWPDDSLLPHPSEKDIVVEALAHHRDRLANELATARPEVVVTLGNAALRVFRRLILASSDEMLDKLSASAYGIQLKVEQAGNRTVTWWPLAHPGAPQQYQKAHDQWIASPPA